MSNKQLLYYSYVKSYPAGVCAFMYTLYGASPFPPELDLIQVLKAHEWNMIVLNFEEDFSEFISHQSSVIIGKKR